MDHTRRLKYILSKSRQMKVLRGIETAVKEGIEEMVFDRYRYRGVEEQPIRCKNRSSIYPPAVEKLSMRQKVSRSIHQVSRSYRGGRRFLDLSTRYWEAVKIAIWKSLRSSTDSMVSRRCQGGVELAFKSSFSWSEKHRHECNPIYNSTNDPNTI